MRWNLLLLLPIQLSIHSIDAFTSHRGMIGVSSSSTSPVVRHSPTSNSYRSNSDVIHDNRRSSSKLIQSQRHDTRHCMLTAAAASLLAGSFAGAVGVGVAFPLDTLKTKSQVMDRSAANLGMVALMKAIYEAEGIIGFFGGVRAMMAGQALIKALAFSANTYALNQLNTSAYVAEHSDMIPGVFILILAAAFSGFVTSFVVAPVERVKVMMQAQSGPDAYANELECINAVLKKEGIGGLMGRGLSTTIAREVPSYCIYFVVYGVLMSTSLFIWMDKLAPLVAGALSGMACWIPVYPIDVVKTLEQNTEGDDENGRRGTLEIAAELYAEGGIGAFFDGLTPKMLRAAVNHAVTFWLYELVMSSMTTV